MNSETPWLQAQDLSLYPCLSKGIDSNVYRIGDWVAKEYQRLSHDEVAAYVDLNRRASVALERTPYRTRINLNGVDTELVAETVVPVAWQGRSPSGKPMTFSRYVEATNLEKLLWRPEKFKAYADAELSTTSLRAFAERLNAFLWDEYPTRAQDELHYHTCMISRIFDQALGANGLYISKYNIKLEPTANPARINLIITDLALYIERVTRLQAAA